MQQDDKTRNILESLLARTGGWYISIIVAFAQIAASLTILLGIISEKLNADYVPEVNSLLNKFTLLALPSATLLLLAVSLVLSRKIRTKLNKWRQSPALFESEDDGEAWKDSHALTWKFALSAAVTSVAFIVIPKTFLIYSSDLANEDQVIYGLIAGMVTNFAFVPLSTVILDRLMAPVRKVLLPKEFSKQLTGLGNIKILNKTLAVVFSSLIITALLIAPIGYHQTKRALYYEVGSYDVLVALQIESILVSGLAILFAFGLTYLFTKSISDPLAQLMDAFSKVESGDLGARAPVTSSDEISKMAIYFNRMVSRLHELQSDLEEKVDERTSQLKAINEVGRVATSILDPEELLKRVVNLIAKEFGYYYSALYLMDNSGRWCDLKAATGEVGRVLLESKHKIEINSTNIIGRSIRTRQAQIFSQSGEKASKLDNPLLPYTRSEIVLPLLVGDQILGVLDVHSSQGSAFNDHDIETLQNMANQVAISLDNARLFHETRHRLNELRNIQKQYLREAWIDINLPQGGISLSIGDASQTDTNNQVDIPITLRDQTIGQLMVKGEEPLSADDKNWIEAVVTQTALALENARLLEESQSAAMREKFVTEITNKIWASTSIEGALQTTVQELGQILDATDALIEINIDEN